MLAAATAQPEEFIRNHFFAMRPYAYRTQVSAAYDDFRNEISRLLAIQPADVCLIGSARTGFSLNKDHLLRPFSRKSDLDFILVSSAIFDDCWDELIRSKEAFDLVGTDERARFRKTRDNFFNGYLRADQLPLGSTLSREWFPLLSGPFGCPIARLHPVKAWLFKSWAHATGCYKDHVASIQTDLAKLLRFRGEL